MTPLKTARAIAKLGSTMTIVDGDDSTQYRLVIDSGVLGIEAI